MGMQEEGMVGLPKPDSPGTRRSSTAQREGNNSIRGSGQHQGQAAPCQGELPRLTGAVCSAGLCPQAPAGLWVTHRGRLRHRTAESKALGDTHRLLRVNFLQDKKAKRRDLSGTGEPGEGWAGHGTQAVLTIMSIMVLMVSSTSSSRVGFRLVAVKLRR